MFDKFLLDSKVQGDELKMQQNMILGKAVQDRLSDILNNSKTTTTEYYSYFEQISSILQEVRLGYEKVYGTSKPKIDYSQISEEFLER